MFANMKRSSKAAESDVQYSSQSSSSMDVFKPKNLGRKLFSGHRKFRDAKKVGRNASKKSDPEVTQSSTKARIDHVNDENLHLEPRMYPTSQNQAPANAPFASETVSAQVFDGHTPYFAHSLY
jgi:hypothetical protein